MPETLIQNADQIVLREQDEIHEIIGHPPGWILRSGITVVTLLVVIFGLMSWVIKYPDLLAAPVIITTENPVIRVVANSSGKLEHIFADDQTMVEEGDPILLIESTAEWSDIQTLASFLEKLENNNNIASLNIPEQLVLGDLQPTYTRLVQQLNEQRYYLQQQGDQVKITAAQQQISSYEALNRNLDKQITLFEQELALTKKNAKRTRQLYESGVSSLMDAENDEKGYLQNQRQLENLQAQAINNELAIEQLHTQIADIQQSRQDGFQGRTLAIQETLRNLQNGLQTWRQMYLLTAPISGQVAMTKSWSTEQFINANTEVVTLIPTEGAGALIAQAQMPSTGIGKVQKGMFANITLEAYPTQEYGLLRAQITHIALLPDTETTEQNSYLVTLALPQGLTTTYDRRLPLQQEMSGTAEIITEDKRILERVLEQVLDILKNN